MRLFSLFYDAALHLYALSMLPKMLWQHKKYSGTFLKRLGFGFPHIEKADKKLVWVHAVSLGETHAVSSLIVRLKSLENPPLILLTATTKTGFEAGKGMADFHTYLPFDFSYSIARIVKKIAPDLVILTETDLWCHFQRAAKQVGAKIAVVNAKISERSYNRLQRFSFLQKYLLAPIDHFFLQSSCYQKRFELLQVAVSKMTVTGNLKLDLNPQPPSEDLKIKLKLGSSLLLTLGSTHAPEEKLWLENLLELWKLFPTLKVLLVPRHPERFQEVARLLSLHSLSFGRFSCQDSFEDKNIILVDAMGILKDCYAISTLTFVGGSFAEHVGGHNILEPSFYGKPVIFGPYMSSQPDFVRLMHQYEAGIQVSKKTLLTTTKELLSDTKKMQKLGENGLKLIADSRGALERTFSYIQCLLQKNGS